MKYKVGDSLKVITEMFEGIGVYKGATILVVKECETEGQWLDRRGVEAEALNTFANGKYFELVEEEKVKNRFAIGDKVITITDTSDVPEGFIGHIASINGSIWPYTVVDDKGKSECFKEDELELLAYGMNSPQFAANITPKDIEGIVKEEAEYTGGSSSYYKVDVTHPTTSDTPYQAECNDVIEALGLTFTEGNIFKAIWRIAADRQGKKKKGNNSVYDAEKVVFFAERLLIQEKSKEGK